MKKRIFFIINPISGVRNKLKAKLPELIEEILGKNYDFAIKYTESKGHARELAREAVEKGYEIIGVAGGDGSVNEVASALMHNNAVMAVIPLGSGNGLARHMKISMDIRVALEAINQHKVEKIDLCEYHNLIFCSNAGLGFDAFVTKLFARSKVRGLYSYVKSIFKALFTYPFYRYKLNADGKTYEGEAFLITAFNANQYGYNFKIAPQADLQDGKLDVFIVKKFPKWKAFIIMAKVVSGMQKHTKYVDSIKASKIIIETEKRVHFQIDGEQVPKEKKVEINVLPNALNIVMP